jgi:hypothetical protein
LQTGRTPSGTTSPCSRLSTPLSLLLPLLLLLLLPLLVFLWMASLTLPTEPSPPEVCIADPAAAAVSDDVLELMWRVVVVVADDVLLVVMLLIMAALPMPRVSAAVCSNRTGSNAAINELTPSTQCFIVVASIDCGCQYCSALTVVAKYACWAVGGVSPAKSESV